jgi:opacity protein-like surface antigen
VSSGNARKILAVLLALAAGPAAAQAYTRQAYVEPSPRTIELTPWAGLFWSSGVDSANGALVFDVAPGAGAVVDIQVDGKSQVEILYLLARPQARFESSSSFYASSPSFGVTTQYLQLGGLTTFDQGSLEPFLAGGLGIAWFSPSDVQADEGVTIQPQDAWLFAFHLGGGVKWWLSEKIGLRFQARFLLPVLFSSGTFLSGPNGAALQVNAGIPVVQGDVSLGLAISP